MEGQRLPKFRLELDDTTPSNTGHHFRTSSLCAPRFRLSWQLSKLSTIGTSKFQPDHPAHQKRRAMATSSTADDSAKLQILKDALYEEMRQHGSETRLFTQNDLLDLGIIPNNNVVLLVRAVQGLTDDKLLVGTTNHHAGLAWRWRSREEAKK
jgi:hypothetical protein